MKKYIYTIPLLCAVIVGCRKEPLLTYKSGDNIYLNYKDSGAYVFTFAYNPVVQSDTVWVPVKISGTRSTHDRSFVLSVIPGQTTAVSDLHYMALKSSYTMPADSGSVNVPIILKNADTALANKSVVLTIQVSGGKDFGSNLPDSNRTKKISFSNRLEKPLWWDGWPAMGDYSRVKHQLFLISSGTIDLVVPDSFPEWNFQIPRTLYYIGNARNFLLDPFTWVQENPDKGYVLTKRTDSSGDYDFYNVKNPRQKFHLKYFPVSGLYYFIDENLNLVIISNA